MPAEQEIVHWYNQVPDIANGEIQDDYPATHNDYPATYISKLIDLLNRLCNSEGNITWEFRDGFINIIRSGIDSTTFSFYLSQWLDNEREVKRYLREWFPSFSIPYTMGGIANHIAPTTPTIDSVRSSIDTAELTAISATTPTQAMLIDYARGHFDNLECRTTPIINVIPIRPHPRNPFNDRIVETLTQVATYLNTQLHYIISDTHVTIEDRSFSPAYSSSLTLDTFEMRALPIVEIARKIQLARARSSISYTSNSFEFPRRDNGYSVEHRSLPLNPPPNMVIRAIDTNTNPSTCTGKEEASDINYLDVI